MRNWNVAKSVKSFKVKLQIVAVFFYYRTFGKDPQSFISEKSIKDIRKNIRSKQMRTLMLGHRTVERLVV